MTKKKTKKESKNAKKLISKIKKITKKIVSPKKNKKSTKKIVKKTKKQEQTISKKVATKLAKLKVKKIEKEEVKDKSAESKKVTKELLLEKGKKQGYLTYEEVMEYSDKQKLSDEGLNNLLKFFEKENVELITQAESKEVYEEGSNVGPEEPSVDIKGKLETIIDLSSEEEEEEGDGSKEDIVKGVTEATQISDGVKCYLRDIGKIPLLNKKTEKLIADRIAKGKNDSVDAIARFPFVHKEFLLIGEKLQKNTQGS